MRIPSDIYFYIFTFGFIEISDHQMIRVDFDVDVDVCNGGIWLLRKNQRVCEFSRLVGPKKKVGEGKTFSGDGFCVGQILSF